MNLWQKLVAGGVAVVALGSAFGGGTWVGYEAGKKVDSNPPTEFGRCADAWSLEHRQGKPIAWGALGDSYSAGVGGPLRSQLWDRDIANAYSVGAVERFRDAQGLGLEFKFSACGGAVIDDVIGDLTADSTRGRNFDISWWHNAPPPLSAVRDADVASLTLGGNDAGFGKLIWDCFPRRCSLIHDGGTAGTYEGTPEQEWARLRDRLANAYQVVRQVMKPGGYLYVLSYPIPFGTSPCGLSNGLGDDDIHRLNQFAMKLDDQVAGAVADANAALNQAMGQSDHVVLVDWRTKTIGPPPTSVANLDGVDVEVPYNPDGICSSDPMTLFLAPFEARDRSVQDSLHPSSTGVHIAACRLARAVLETQLAPNYSADLTDCG